MWCLMKNKQVIILITIIIISIIVGSTLILKQNNKTPINRHSKLTDIVFEENKVNIYFFWGDGCNHCQNQFKFFESIQNEYQDYFNLYAFEVWHNDDNTQILNNFSEIMEDKVSGVPYTIIGNKTFTGYNETKKSELISTIIEQSQNKDDVYQQYLDK